MEELLNASNEETIDVIIKISVTIPKNFNKSTIFGAPNSGCSTVGSVPVWGAGGRVVESRQPD